jgi:hypothetical protein
MEMDEPYKSSVLGRIIQEENSQWHFDPLEPSQDYWSCGNIVDRAGKSWDDLVEFARTVDTKVPRDSIFDFDKSQTDDEDFMRIVNQIRDMGYDRKNTLQHKTYSDKFPEIFDPILDSFALINPIGSLIHQKPGWMCPWHYDPCTFYMRKFSIQDPMQVRRYLVFLENWVWGHYMLIGNSVVHQWRAGDVVLLPYRMRHLSANAGLTPKLTLQVTGKVVDADQGPSI